MKNKGKRNLKIILLTLITALIGTLFSMGSQEYYESLIKPAFSPPPQIFPIAWSVLYVLMAIAMIVYLGNSFNKDNEENLYYIQLIFNALWPLTFFFFKLNWFSVVIIAILILVNLVLLKQLSAKPLAFYLYLPYVIWLLYAAYLNIGIAILN